MHNREGKTMTNEICKSCNETVGIAHYCNNTFVNTSADSAELTALRDENKRLREALENYSGHRMTCPVQYDIFEMACTCGYKQALGATSHEI